jgi:hypothetical protein
MAPARSRLEMAREPVDGLSKGYESLVKRLASLPLHRDWQQADMLPGLHSDAEGLRERVDLCLSVLRAELESLQSRALPVEQVRAGETHCAACGRVVPKAPFCPQCGAVQAAVIACPQCGEKNLLPLHFFPEAVPSSRELFCASCGTALTAVVRALRPDGTLPGSGNPT